MDRSPSQRTPSARIAEVALAASPRAFVLAALTEDWRRRAVPSRRHLAIGGVCPHCRRAIVIVAVGAWRAADLALVLRDATHCLHAPLARRRAG